MIGRLVRRVPAVRMSVWRGVPQGPRDAILGLNEAYAGDASGDKVNLGVGAYRDDAGRPVVLACVRRAEAEVVAAAPGHEYAGIDGVRAFVDAAVGLAYGDAVPRERVAAAQSLSGTGALRLGAAFAARFLGGARVYVPRPTWGNHAAVFRDAGVIAPPAVFGHEGSGVVEKVGSRIRKVAPGDRVALTFRSCGACPRCDTGHAAYCQTMPFLNYTGMRTDETLAAWRVALERRNPTVFVFSRQNLPVLDASKYPVAEGVARGAYVLVDGGDIPDIVLIATGSEVALALRAADELAVKKVRARVVSMPSWELFGEQAQGYRDAVIPPAVKKRLAVEAGATLGWWKWVGDEGDVIGIDRFGASAPGDVLMEKFGFTVENVVARALKLLGRG